MSNADKTLVTVATYNEMENLPQLVEEVFRYAPQADLLVIDDNSPDGTGQWCEQRRAEDPRVACLHRQGKLGLGTAIIAGMKHAIEHGYKYVLDFLYAHVPVEGPTIVEGQGLVVALTYRLITLLIAALGIFYYLGNRREMAEVIHEAEEEERELAPQ